MNSFHFARAMPFLLTTPGFGAASADMKASEHMAGFNG